MSSFGKLKKPTNSSTSASSSSSSSSTSFNPLELLNKLRSDGGQDPGAVVHTRGSPMESPLKPSPLLGSSNSEGTIGRNGLEMNSPGEYLTIAEGETNEAFEQRIKHFKELQEMNAEIHRLRKQNKKLLQEKDALRRQMAEQKSRADNTIAQLRSKLATPSEAQRNLNQFPTFGPPKKPFYSVGTKSGLKSPEPPSPLMAGKPQFFVPSYPTDNGGFHGDDMNSMRSPYQDPTFNTMMRMSTPSQGIYGENGYDAYAGTLRRGSTGHEDPAMTMRMSQGQSQASSSVGPLEGTSLPDEEEDEEIYHIDLSN